MNAQWFDRAAVLSHRQNGVLSKVGGRVAELLADLTVYRYCGTNSNLTIDHVVPASKGGKWEWTNLVTACIRCNGKKGAKSLKQLKWTLKKEPRV